LGYGCDRQTINPNPAKEDNVPPEGVLMVKAYALTSFQELDLTGKHPTSIFLIIYIIK